VSDSYWLEEPARPIPTRRLNGRVDVAVVGGGITGCSCALRLAQNGARVRLHDARDIASGASGRNGGFALRGGAASYDVTAESIGRDRARVLWQRTEVALDRFESFAGDAFQRTGSLRLAADGEERDSLRAEFDALVEDGFDAEWRETPLGGRFEAAIFHPRDGSVQPARLVRGLASAAADAGVDIRERDRVSDREGVEADQVVVATDGYPSGLLGPLEGLIVPTRGQVIATEPLSERVFACPHSSRHGFEYWQQVPDGRIVAGGFRDISLDSEFTDVEETTPTIQNALEEHIVGLLGRQVEVTHRWAGIFGLVLDFLPVVGRVPGLDDTWVAGGYSGHGNVLGMMCGELLADAIQGRPSPELELFEPARLLL
jgi:glycine/D-amino acid oxidase-like deaminating enzyme